MNQSDRDSAENWKTPTLIVGAVIGAILGAIAGRLFADADAAAREKDRQHGPHGLQLSLPLLIPFALTIISLLRQIGELAKSDRK